MNTELLNDLIKKGGEFSFKNNSYSANGEFYSQSSEGLLAWIVKIEDYLLNNYGENSAPYNLYKTFQRRFLDGYYQRDFDKQLTILRGVLKSCNDIPIKTYEKIKIKQTEVFIVHGHDEEAKTKTARFIENLGFKPIILHEQAISGNTIIENIEKYSNVGFGIVLYSPCDVGAKKEETPKLKNRARQNVVFEHGFLIGKIGRKNVCALVKDEIETPNDISGVLFIKMDQEDAWYLKVAKEMRSSGYEVDLNKL